VLANPIAGGGLAQDALPRLTRYAAEHHWNADFRTAESSTAFAEIAKQEGQHGRERIFALGGDGTFQVLLNAVAHLPKISIGVLPAGGGNDLACALGLPSDPVKAAEIILRRGEACRLDAARVRTADGVERLYMGGGGIGLDAEAARYASGAYRRIRGRSRYLLSAIHAVSHFQPVGVRIACQNSAQTTIERRVLVAGVLNTPSYGAGLRLAPEADLADGQLDLAILDALSWFEILRVLPALAISGEMRTKRIQRFRVRQARIETDRPSMFHADGEMIGSTPVDITVVPGARKVWRAAMNSPGGPNPRNR
jgi:YegS/Rv2252/BmrU family lipid kinase